MHRSSEKRAKFLDLWVGLPTYVQGNLSYFCSSLVRPHHEYCVKFCSSYLEKTNKDNRESTASNNYQDDSRTEKQILREQINLFSLKMVEVIIKKYSTLSNGVVESNIVDTFTNS